MLHVFSCISISQLLNLSLYVKLILFFYHGITHILPISLIIGRQQFSETIFLAFLLPSFYFSFFMLLLFTGLYDIIAGIFLLHRITNNGTRRFFSWLDGIQYLDYIFIISVFSFHSYQLNKVPELYVRANDKIRVQWKRKARKKWQEKMFRILQKKHDKRD